VSRNATPRARGLTEAQELGFVRTQRWARSEVRLAAPPRRGVAGESPPHPLPGARPGDFSPRPAHSGAWRASPIAPAARPDGTPLMPSLVWLGGMGHPHSSHRVLVTMQKCSYKRAGGASPGGDSRGWHSRPPFRSSHGTRTAAVGRTQLARGPVVQRGDLHQPLGRNRHPTTRHADTTPPLTPLPNASRRAPRPTPQDLARSGWGAGLGIVSRRARAAARARLVCLSSW
jgi:hypothetical protein